MCEPDWWNEEPVHPSFEEDKTRRIAAETALAVAEARVKVLEDALEVLLSMCFVPPGDIPMRMQPIRKIITEALTGDGAECPK